MALVEYITTDWINGTTPAINEDNLNHLEIGVKEVTDEVLSIGVIPPGGFNDKVSNITANPGENGIVTLVWCTQATYDAITPVSSTLYVIKG
jgi:hypothetical protein